jgi:hypothetical protein
MSYLLLAKGANIDAQDKVQFVQIAAVVFVLGAHSTYVGDTVQLDSTSRSSRKWPCADRELVA